MLEESCFKAGELLEYVNNDGLSNEPLAESDLGQILATLVWDDKLTIIEQDGLVVPTPRLQCCCAGPRTATCYRRLRSV